jgi:maltose phosphorylase
VLSFQPTLPSQWKSYRFRVCYQGAVIEARVRPERAEFQVISGSLVTVRVCGKEYDLSAQSTIVKLDQRVD